MAIKYYNGVAYDDELDYSTEIEKAKAQGKDTSALETARQAKIGGKYGGKEPTMNGSNKTYSQLSSSGSSSDKRQITNSILSKPGGSVTYNNPSGNPVTITNTGKSWEEGVDYAQKAWDAAESVYKQYGYIDLDEIDDILDRRQDKIDALGMTNVQSNLDIWNSILGYYGYDTSSSGSGGSSSGGGSGGSGGGSWSENYGSGDYGTSSKPSYNDNSLNDRINSMLDKILNRDSFSYNAAEDPLYKQYANMYQREGTRAMNDAMMAAAATAGGMNSYAMTAANQANNYYMAQMNDKIPELYQLAYEMYLKDIDNQVRDLGLLQGMDDTQYGRYRDTMSDWYNDRDFAYGVYRDDVADNQWQQQFDTTNSHWQQEFDAANKHWQQEFDHTVGQDALAQANRDKEWAYETGQTTGNTAYAKAMELLNAGAMPDAAMLKEAGMTEEQAAAILAQRQLEQGGAVTGGYDSGSDSGNDGGKDTPAKDKTGSGYDNGSLSTAQVKKLQQYYGVAADGLWGKNSQKAAGGLSADAAWAAYQKIKDKGDSGNDAGDSELYNAILDLGIGPVSEDTVWSIINAGGIVETANGFSWANGWNKNNWQDKMRGVVSTGGIGLYAGINF